MLMSSWEAVGCILGLTALTVLTRGFFSLTRREMPFPPWLQAGLRHAPLAALVAVVAPQVLMPGGQWLHQWLDPRVLGALAGGTYFFCRRGILGTIVCGMAIFTIARLTIAA
jgi:branched-subunit amino acid transport protein